MKGYLKASLAFLTLVMASLSAVPYLTNPRELHFPLVSTLLSASHAMLGEQCLGRYRINLRSDAVAYARKLWDTERLRIRVQGDEAAAKAMFDSLPFREGGGIDRGFPGDGWLVGRSDIGDWEISYAFSNSIVSAFLYADFTVCGHVTSSGSKIFRTSNG